MKEIKKIKSISIKYENSGIIHISSESAIKSKNNFTYLLAEVDGVGATLDTYTTELGIFQGKQTRCFFTSCPPQKRYLIKNADRIYEDQIISTHHQCHSDKLPVYEVSDKKGVKTIFVFSYDKVSPKDSVYFNYEKKNLISQIIIKDNSLAVYTMNIKMLKYGHKQHNVAMEAEEAKQSDVVNPDVQWNNVKTLKLINTFIEAELKKSKKTSTTNYLRIKLKNGLYNVYEIRNKFARKANMYGSKGPIYKSVGCRIESAEI